MPFGLRDNIATISCTEDYREAIFVRLLRQPSTAGYQIPAYPVTINYNGMKLCMSLDAYPLLFLCAIANQRMHECEHPSDL